MDKNHARLFATTNSISPYYIVYGVWPSRSRLMQCCNRGVKIATRYTDKDEDDEIKNSPRHLGRQFKTLADLLAHEFYYSEGNGIPEYFKWLVSKVIAMRSTLLRVKANRLKNVARRNKRKEKRRG